MKIEIDAKKLIKDILNLTLIIATSSVVAITLIYFIINK